MNSDTPASVVSIVVRVFWMMIGPVFLFLIALSMAMNGGGWFAPRSIAYLVMTAALLGARWYEFRLGNPLTEMGTRATPEDLRRYALWTSLTALGVWAVANLIGDFGLLT